MDRHEGGNGGFMALRRCVEGLCIGEVEEGLYMRSKGLNGPFDGRYMSA